MKLIHKYKITHIFHLDISLTLAYYTDRYYLNNCVLAYKFAVTYEQVGFNYVTMPQGQQHLRCSAVEVKTNLSNYITQEGMSAISSFIYSLVTEEVPSFLSIVALLLLLWLSTLEISRMSL